MGFASDPQAHKRFWLTVCSLFLLVPAPCYLLQCLLLFLWVSIAALAASDPWMLHPSSNKSLVQQPAILLLLQRAPDKIFTSTRMSCHSTLDSTEPNDMNLSPTVQDIILACNATDPVIQNFFEANSLQAGVGLLHSSLPCSDNILSLIPLLCISDHCQSWFLAQMTY